MTDDIVDRLRQFASTARPADREDAADEIERLRTALKGLLKYEGHMIWCGHGKNDQRPCVCGFNKAIEDALALFSRAALEDASK